MDDESILDQLKNDIQELFNNEEGYEDLIVKESYEEYPEITYPMVVIGEIENDYVNKFYDLKEHVVNVSYQFTIYADQSETLDAVHNIMNIQNIIKNYMRGERYHALRKIGNTPITKKHDDENIRIGYMRYIGRIDIDTHTIYRRN